MAKTADCSGDGRLELEMRPSADVKWRQNEQGSPLLEFGSNL